MHEDKQELSTGIPTEEEMMQRNREKILRHREKIGLAMPTNDILDSRRDGYSPRDSGRISPRPQSGRISPRPDTGRMSPRPDTGRMSPRPDTGRYSPRHPSPVGLYRQEVDRTQPTYGLSSLIPGEQDKPTTPRRGSERKSAAPRRHSDRRNISEPERRLEKAKEELRRAREKMGLETPKLWKNMEHDVIHLTYSGPDMDHLIQIEQRSQNDSGFTFGGPFVQNGHLPQSGNYSGQLSPSGSLSHSGLSQFIPSGHDSSRGQLISSGQDSSRSQLIHSGNGIINGQLAYGGNDTGKGQHLYGYVEEGTKSTLPE